MTAALIYGTLSALAFFGLGFLTGNSVGYREAMRDMFKVLARCAREMERAAESDFMGDEYHEAINQARESLRKASP